jgi:PIN domain nuclease of toxin-antitoxin system
MRLLLDTCTFLWVITDAPALSPAARARFTDPANEVFLSAASAWEIGIKWKRGRLPLPQPATSFVADQREAHGIAALGIDEESTLHVTRLPDLHRDPFDRMLVSQAIVHGLVLLTPDPLVTQYPARTLW